MTDLQLMKSPTEWPSWPFLPVKRWVNNQIECCLMMAVENNLTKVFKGLNLWHLPKDKTIKEIIEIAESYDYVSYEAIISDGWEID